MSLEKIKKGDIVMVTEITGGTHPRIVVSAGPKWIKAGGSLYHRCDGRIESGVGVCRIQSVEDYNLECDANQAKRSLRLLGIETHSRVPADKLEAIYKAVKAILEPEP